MENVTNQEALDSFEAFLSMHSEQHKAIYAQMMECIKGMFAEQQQQHSGSSSGAKKRSVSANRIFLGTVNCLAMYTMAHQRLLTSLIQDIADGRIGKVPATKKARNKAAATTSKKDEKKKEEKEAEPHGHAQEDEEPHPESPAQDHLPQP